MLNGKYAHAFMRFWNVAPEYIGHVHQRMASFCRALVTYNLVEILGSLCLSIIFFDNCFNFKKRRKT